MKRFILFTTLFLFTAGLYAGQPQRAAATPFGAEKPQFSVKNVPSDQQQVLAKSGAGDNQIANIHEAADWLLTQQDPGGGFPWSVGDPNIYSNVQGPAGRGMLAGWNEARQPVHMTSATACGDYLVPTYPRTYTDGDPRFATHDPLFLEELSLKKAVSTYSDFVQTYFWDKLTAGTYGETNDMDAFDFGQSVIDSRNAQGYALGPWDISAIAVAAHVGGETAIANDIMAAIQNGVDSMQVGDTWDIIGLAGAIWASSVTGVDLDPTVGEWASSSSTADLVTELLNLQLADGSWTWSTAVDGTDITDHDTQTTAFAILALKAYDSSTYATEISNAIAFIFSLQQPDGQILIYPGAPTTASGGVETHSEAMQAIGSNDDSLVPVELTSF
ncbi:hypothetical protein KC799_25895, partial [candidate division KSB1 bacterium]|nr:hypothetical protein [candidate division KSB1 bacterium]